MSRFNSPKTDSEDILEWADGTWCFRDELPWMTHMSDDYRVLPFDSIEWRKTIDAVEEDEV